jgi:carboxylate-amine ligase
VATESIDGPARLYWDVRPSAKYDTLELRVADVCTSVDDAVLVAALARALVASCLDAVDAGRPPPDVRPELLRSATWRAAHDGIDGRLVDVPERRAAPAREVVRRLVDVTADALDHYGDRPRVDELVDAVFARGTSARRQREVLRRDRSLAAVVDWLARETCAAC